MGRAGPVRSLVRIREVGEAVLDRRASDGEGAVAFLLAWSGACGCGWRCSQ